MKRVYYNKLIRDRIPVIMRKKGKAFEIRTLDRKDFERELLKKAGEEASGLLAAKTKKELIGELADVIDVIDEIRKVKKISGAAIATARKQNLARKGGFQKWIFLVWSQSDEYRTNEQRYRDHAGISRK